MSEPTDQHLLRAWAERADEAAFRSLAGRYAGFVHGAALRRTGDAGLAEEITQDVFAALARDARKLATHPTLAGWLHRAAMLTALDRVRRRARHDRRIAAFHAMHDDPSARDPWGEIAPHLDEALDRLRTADRAALMLHFAERLTFPQIAARLGTSADAARMRTKRALEVLAGMLRKKGVVVPAAVLGAGLGGTFAQAAPATLALTPAALAGAGKVGALTVVIHAFQTMKTVQLASAAVLALALAAPLTFQHFAIAETRTRIAALEKQMPPAASAAAGERPAASARADTATQSLELGRIIEDALEGGVIGRVKLRASIAHLDANNLAGLIETVWGGSFVPGGKNAAVLALLDELGQRAPAESLALSLRFAHETGDLYFSGELIRAGVTKLQLWAARDPQAALAWLRANEGQFAFAANIRVPGKNSYLTILDDVRATLAGTLFASAPGDALQILGAFDEKQTAAAFMVALQTPEAARAATRWALANADETKRFRYLTEIAKAIGRRMEVSQSLDDDAVKEFGEWTNSLGLSGSQLANIAARGLDKVNVSGIATKAIALLPADVRERVRGEYAATAKQGDAVFRAAVEEGADDDFFSGYVMSDYRYRFQRLSDSLVQKRLDAVTRIRDAGRRREALGWLVAEYRTCLAESGKDWSESVIAPQLAKGGVAPDEAAEALKHSTDRIPK